MDIQATTVVLVLAKATALLLLGAVVAGLLRNAAAGARHLVWLATLAGLLALPVSLQVTALRLPLLPRLDAAAPLAFAPAAQAATSAPLARAKDAARTVVPMATVTGAAASLPLLRDLALGLWLAVGLVLVAWLVAGAVAVRRIVRAGRVLDDARWQALLCEAADRLDVAELPRLVAGDVEMPFACGMLRPTIVLPADAEAWSDERRRLVLVHELAHVRRRDLAAHAVSRLACAIYWFHPLVWGAARRLRAEGERACDDMVLACGARASDYAGFLLDVVTTARRRGAPLAAVPMARRREIEGRVLAILDPALRRGTPGRLQAGALVAGLAGAFILVAATAPTAPAQVPGPAAAPARAAVAAADAEDTVEADDAAEASQEKDADEAPARRAPAKVSPAVAAERRSMLARVAHDDPDASVRRTAVWALGQSDDGVDAATLAAVLRADADPEVREMAAWALGEADEKARGGEARAALADALRRDAGDEVRATAAWALGQSEGADTAALSAGVADRVADVRKAALWAIGQQGLKKAPAGVADALKDGDAEVRLAAAWALGEIEDPAAGPALIAAFSSEQDKEVRRAMFRTLAILEDTSPAFLEKALHSDDPELRSRAILLQAGHGPGIWPWPWPWPQPRPMP